MPRSCFLVHCPERRHIPASDLEFIGRLRTRLSASPLNCIWQTHELSIQLMRAADHVAVGSYTPSQWNEGATRDQA